LAGLLQLTLELKSLKHRYDILGAENE